MKHSRHIIRLTVFLGLLLTNLSILSAQTVVLDVPLEYEESIDVWETDGERASSPYHRNRLDDQYAKSLEEGFVVQVVGQLVKRFENEDWGPNEVEQSKILNRLNLFHTAMKFALAQPGIEGIPNQLVEQELFLRAFNDQHFGLNSLQMQILSDSNGEEVPGYFGGQADEILLYEWTAEGDSVRLLLEPKQVRQWRFLQNTLSTLVNNMADKLRSVNIRDLTLAVDRWENFLERGYSQMPWESFINGYLIRPPGLPKLGPPGHQWIILHPSVGFELKVDSVDELRVKEVMNIELLGHIHYWGERLDKLWGLSISTTLRDDMDPGLGVQLHLSRNWNLGVSWHDFEEDPFLFMSVDLFSAASREAPRYLAAYQEQRKKLGLD
jgi:hypothetical protein